MQIDMNTVDQINQIPDFKERIFAAAKMYVDAGIPIVPLRPKSKVLPEAKKGVNYTHATTNPKTVKKWFDSESGTFAGYNIGIACGRDGGVFAIDVDRHGEHDGWETIRNYTEKHGEIIAPRQITPNSGYHYLFAWGSCGGSSAGKIGLGVDTRGGTIDRCTGHIVAWPSTLGDDRGYTWDTGGELPDIPKWVDELLGEAGEWVAQKGDDELDQQAQYSIAQIAHLLKQVDPDLMGYEDWIKVGQAIHSQHPSETGFNLWDEWSSKGKSREDGECQPHWKSFNGAKGIRVGTLFHYAKEQGWDQSTDSEMMRGDFGPLVAQMNETHAVAMLGGDKLRVMRSESKKFHVFTRKDFLDYYENNTRPSVNDKGNLVIRSVAQIWLADPNRRECDSMGFYPGEDKWYKNNVNRWRGWGCNSEKGNWSLLKDHIHAIICRSDEAMTTWVLDWLAQILQDPMTLAGTALVMIGPEGAGKGTLPHFLGKICGDQHYIHLTHDNHLTGNFTGHLIDKLLVFADEVTWGGNRKTAGVLKGLVTEPTLTCEIKGLTAFPYENRSRVIVASNEDWVIPAGPGSRRWCVLDVSGEKRNSAPYFKAIHKQMNEGGMEAMFHELLDRGITSNLQLAPETELLQDQRSLLAMSGNPFTVWYFDVLTNGIMPVVGEQETIPGKEHDPWPEEVDRKQLHQAFEEWCQAKNTGWNRGIIGFYRELGKLGWTKRRVTKGTARGYVFMVPPLEECRRVAKEKLGYDEES